MPFLTPHTTIRTSIRITESDVTVVKFKPGEGKIITLYQQPLPQGIIVSGRVVESDKLNSLVKTALAQSKSQAEAVSVGFPEGKTFITTLKLADVGKEDINEAVRWQAEEMLPSPLENIYFDWQELKDSPVKDRDTAHHLVLVSVPRESLDPFLAAVIKAGAKPISCEPTSVSLARLIPSGEVALAAEVRQTESTLVIVDQNKAIRLSSMVPAEEVVTQVKQMRQWWAKKYGADINRLYLCGEGATPEWQAYLQTQVGLAVAAMPLGSVINLPSPASVFAVAISLALKQLGPPKDPTTINLLPEMIQTEYEKTAEKQSLSFGVKFGITTLAVTTMVMLIGFVWLKLQLTQAKRTLTAEEQSESQTSYAQAAKQAEAANFQARLVNRLPPQDKLDQILTELTEAVPSGVKLSGYTVNLPERVVLVNGLADTRDDLLRFKSSLEQQTSFALVTIPLPTLEKKTAVDFSIAVDIKKDK